MTDPVIRSFLQNRGFNDVASYIAGGRSLRPLSDDDLIARWVAGFGQLANNPMGQEEHHRLSEAEAELAVRQIEPDLALISDELEEFDANSKKLLDDLRADPSRWEDFKLSLGEDLAEFACGAENAQKAKN